MRNLLSQLLAIGPELAAFILTSPLLGSKGAYAIQQQLAPSPDLDLEDLGRVAVVGDFDSISVYTYEGQNENVLSINGSSTLLTQYPNGAFESLASSDAYIETMCQFGGHNGKSAGVVVGGNFTSLGGVKAQSIALWDPDSNHVTALPGINGKVSAVYCDNDSGTVYVGGMFTASTSQNAMAYTTDWQNLPFAGFNGPVYSITKNSAGHIVFGGDFDGLGDSTSLGQGTTSQIQNSQVVNLAGGDVSAEGSTSLKGFSDPHNVICKTGDDGEDNTWLLSDNRGGFWEGSYSFGFVPTKLRLYNTKYQGRGTKSFYYENLASGGVLSLRYIDADGNNQSCSGSCPLPKGDTSAQDFFFNQPVGTQNFRIWINDWYGDGAGFSGIELFQDDIYSFAINDFNEPNCDGFSKVSASTVNPANSSLWTRVPNNGATSSDYLSARLTDQSQASSGTSVVFTPDIPQSGNYSITVYTPGCLQDNSCATRGLVNMTGSMTSDKPPVSTTIAQTNDYDKYDPIYYGYVDVDTEAFTPSVTLTPIAGELRPQTIVAQRVRFELVPSTGGLNGLFEYNPDKANIDTDDFSNSAINSAGADLEPGAIINCVVSSSNQVYVAGNFSGNGMSNIMSISDNATSLPSGGLNDNVQAMHLDGSMMYLGGNFTDTIDGSTDGLANVAAFNIDNDEWIALGAGVNGPVLDMVPVTLNVTAGKLENCITVNGEFSSVNAFDDNDAFDTKGFAVWVPSKKNWLNNIPNAAIEVHGKLYSETQVSSLKYPLYAGQLSAQALGLSGAVEMVGSGLPSLQSLGLTLDMTDTSSPSQRKRAIDISQNNTGVYTGLFYEDNDLNITVLGGHFATTASDGSTVENLVFIEDTDSGQQVTGISELDSDSIVGALAYQGNLLFAGGSITGTVDDKELGGLVVYNLKKGAVASPHPPALTGDNVFANVIAPQPDSSNVFVGGNFEKAGALPCETLCYYDTGAHQWNTPGPELSGTITSMFWSSKTQLIIAGDLTVGGNQTTMATYDSKKQVFQAYDGGSKLPGGITTLTPASGDYKHFWAAGIATNNNSAFLSYYSDGKWTGVGGFESGTVIRGLQVLSLTSGHDSTDLLSGSEALMVVGNINVAGYGNASACLFNGTDFVPFVLTNKDDGSQGTIASIFVSNPQNLMKMGGGNLAVGFVVLIGLAIALGIIFLIVVAGILMERARRRREGYMQMTPDKNGNLQRIPPETLLSGLNGEKASAPKV